MTSAPAALWHSISFYSSSMVGLPFAGLLLALAILVTRDTRLKFALGAIVYEIGMYLLIPGRMLDVYLYPGHDVRGDRDRDAGDAIIRRTVAMLVMIWAVWQITLTRKHAAVTIAEAKDRRAYAAALRETPKQRVYAYAAAPESFGMFGGEYAIRVITNASPVYRLEDNQFPAAQQLPVLVWDSRRRQLSRSMLTMNQVTYIDKAHPPARWQGNWPVDDQGYHTINVLTTVYLYRPESARAFEMEACGRPGFVLNSAIDSMQLPATSFDTPGCVTVRVPLPPGPARTFD